MKNRYILPIGFILLILALSLLFPKGQGGKDRRSYLSDLAEREFLDDRFNPFLEYIVKKSLGLMDNETPFQINAAYSEDHINFYVFNGRLVDSIGKEDNFTIGNINSKFFHQSCLNNLIALHPNVVLIDSYYLAFLFFECSNEIGVWRQVQLANFNAEDFEGLQDPYLSNYNLISLHRASNYQDLYKGKQAFFDFLIPTTSEASEDSYLTIDEDVACQLEFIESLDDIYASPTVEELGCSGGMMRVAINTGLVYADRFGKSALVGGDSLITIFNLARDFYALKKTMGDDKFSIFANSIDFPVNSLGERLSEALYDLYFPFFSFIIMHELAHIEQFQKGNKIKGLSWISTKDLLLKKINQKQFRLELEADSVAVKAITKFAEEQNPYDEDYMLLPQLMALYRIFRDITIVDALQGFRGINTPDLLVQLHQKLTNDTTIIQNYKPHSFNRLQMVTFNGMPLMTEKEFTTFQDNLLKTGASFTHQHIFTRTLDLMNPLFERYEDIERLGQILAGGYSRLIRFVGEDSISLDPLFQLDTSTQNLIHYSLIKDRIPVLFKDFEQAYKHDLNLTEIALAKSGEGYLELRRNGSDSIKYFKIVLPIKEEFAPSSDVTEVTKWVSELLKDFFFNRDSKEVDLAIGTTFGQLMIYEQSIIQLKTDLANFRLTTLNGNYLAIELISTFSEAIPVISTEDFD